MKTNFELKYHKLEKRHWWSVARRDIILKLLHKHRIKKHHKILEIGCSSGTLLKCLESKGFKNIYGIDVSKNALNACKKERLRNIFLMDGAKPEFSTEEFDTIIASDVLEHIKDDTQAVLRWGQIMTANGKLIIFVPAFKFLWSKHDEANLHYRRYSKSSLAEILEKVGFKVESISYWNFSLFFPKFLLTTIHNIMCKSEKCNQLYEPVPAVNKFLIKLLKFENKILSRFSLPVGVSIFAIARKV